LGGPGGGGPGRPGQAGGPPGTGTGTGRKLGTGGSFGAGGSSGTGHGPGGLPGSGGAGRSGTGAGGQLPGTGTGTGTGSGTGPGTRAGTGGLPGRGGGGGTGGPGGLGGSTKVSQTLTRLLEKNASAYTWVAATVGSESAAPLQLATGQPVMSIGGFNGTDPAPTLARFRQLVAEHKIHYFVGENSDSFGGGSGDAAAITKWVEAHFTARTVGGETVYDLAGAS
jgi:hypothetical protein